MFTGDFALSSSNKMINRLAAELFADCREDWPVMVLLDRNGRFCCSDNPTYRQMNIDSHFLADFCDRIDDGADPIVARSGGCIFTGAQLRSDRTDMCLYMILISQASEIASAVANTNLLEIILNQAEVILRLIEKRDSVDDLYFSQQQGACSPGCCVLN
jgi:hypothetical protein